MKKYRGIFPALYACYDADGHIDPKAVRHMTNLLCGAGVGGIYVNGSIGECDQLSVMEKVAVMENVMAEAAGRVRVVCRVTCSDPGDTLELCRHASACGVDAVVALPQKETRSLNEALDLWQGLARLAGETDLILGPHDLSDPEDGREAERIRLFAENARIRGILLRSKEKSQIPAVRALLGDDVSVIFAGETVGAFSVFSEGLDAIVGGFCTLVPETAVRLESSLRYAFTARTVQDQAVVSAVIDHIGGCSAPLDAAKALFSRLRGMECGQVRAPLPRMSGEDRITVEKCVQALEKRIK